MTMTDNYRRPPFPARPWIRGKLYDDYSRSTILHLDAYLFAFGGNVYLALDWTEGGFKRVALDGYLVESDGLTPVWDIAPMRLAGKPLSWSARNHATLARVHQTVMGRVPVMLSLGLGRWSRVVTLAHYVMRPETDPEPGHGAYSDPKPYASRSKLLDIL